MLELRCFRYRGSTTLWLGGSREDLAAFAAGLASARRRRLLDDLVAYRNTDNVALEFTGPNDLPRATFAWNAVGDPMALRLLDDLVNERAADLVVELEPAPAQLLIERL